MDTSKKEIIEKDVERVRSSVLLEDVIPIEYAKKAVEAYTTIYGKDKNRKRGTA